MRELALAVCFGRRTEARECGAGAGRWWGALTVTYLISAALSTGTKEHGYFQDGPALPLRF
jgi:hypothetical protein